MLLVFDWCGCALWCFDCFVSFVVGVVVVCVLFFFLFVLSMWFSFVLSRLLFSRFLVCCRCRCCFCGGSGVFGVVCWWFVVVCGVVGGCGVWVVWVVRLWFVFLLVFFFMLMFVFFDCLLFVLIVVWCGLRFCPTV